MLLTVAMEFLANGFTFSTDEWIRDESLSYKGAVVSFKDHGVIVRRHQDGRVLVYASNLKHGRLILTPNSDASLEIYIYKVLQEVVEAANL